MMFVSNWFEILHSPRACILADSCVHSIGPICDKLENYLTFICGNFILFLHLVILPMLDESQFFQIRARQDVQAVLNAKLDTQREQRIKLVHKVGILPTISSRYVHVQQIF